MRAWWVAVAVVGWASGALCAAQGAQRAGVADSAFFSGPLVSAGLGVLYFNPHDVVNAINGSGLTAVRVEEFKAYAEFFGSVILPIASDWALMGDYAYILGSYNVPGPFGPGEFTCTIHAPSLLLLYILWQEPLYAVRAGAGGGYHVGAMHASIGTIDDTYRGRGAGFILTLDGSTALGDGLHAYLGAFARWEGIGTLTDESGKSLQGPQGLPAPTLNGFGVGAKIGVSYMF